MRYAKDFYSRILSLLFFMLVSSCCPSEKELVIDDLIFSFLVPKTIVGASLLDEEGNPHKGKKRIFSVNGNNLNVSFPTSVKIKKEFKNEQKNLEASKMGFMFMFTA